MTGIITGDIINSQHSDAEVWLQKLKELFESWHASSADWEIYRGDEFQYKCSAQEVFRRALAIKLAVKTIENLDVRLAIGIGEETYSSEKITESNGSAYVNSGRLLNEIKADGRTIAIKTENAQLDTDLNILLKWTALEFDRWSTSSARILELFFNDESLNQEKAAQILNITQSSVSQGLKRVNYDLILETEKYFRNKISGQK